MNEVIYSVILQLDSDEVSASKLVAIQSDNGTRIIRASFLEGETEEKITTDSKVQLFFAKPNGSTAWVKCTGAYIESDSVGEYDFVEAVLTGDMLSVPGDALGQFLIWNADETLVIRSQRFKMKIGEKLDNLDAEEGDLNYGALEHALDRAINRYMSGRANDFVEVVASYYRNRSDLEYELGGTPWDGKTGNKIDCSALILYGLAGIPYDTSPYCGGTLEANTEYDWAVNFKKEYGVRTAAGICEFLTKAGKSLEANLPDAPTYEDFERIGLSAGDLIFYAKKDDDGNWKQPDRYLHISHIAMVRTVVPGQKYTLLEATTTSTTIPNFNLNEHNRNLNIVAICRPDFSSMAKGRYKAVTMTGTTTKEDLLDLVNQYFEENPPSAGLNETQLANYLTEQGYAKKSYVDAEIEKVDKVEILVNGDIDVDGDGNADFTAGLTEEKVQQMIDSALTEIAEVIG